MQLLRLITVLTPKKSFWIMSILPLGKVILLPSLVEMVPENQPSSTSLQEPLCWLVVRFLSWVRRLRLYLLRSVPNTSHVFSKILKWELLLEWLLRKTFWLPNTVAKNEALNHVIFTYIPRSFKVWLNGLVTVWKNTWKHQQVFYQVVSVKPLAS